MRNWVYAAAITFALGACTGDPNGGVAGGDTAPGADPAASQPEQDTTAADNTGDQTNIDTEWANRQEAEQAATQDEFHPYHYSDNHAQPDPL
ncbi:MAG: hypothetical protein AAF503_15775 [Pseudomonadota bacterium]